MIIIFLGKLNKLSKPQNWGGKNNNNNNDFFLKIK